MRLSTQKTPGATRIVAGDVLVKGECYYRVVKVHRTVSRLCVQSRFGHTGRFTRATGLVELASLHGWRLVVR